MTHLVNVLLAFVVSGIGSKADGKDILFDANAIGLHIVEVCIVEHYVACFSRIGGHEDLIRRIAGGETDICSHTGILNHDAVACLALGELPQIVGSVSAECAINGLVCMFLLERGSDCLVDKTFFDASSGDCDMALMDRIEGTDVDADSFHIIFRSYRPGY